MKHKELELISLFDFLQQSAEEWNIESVLDNTIKLGNLIKPQLDEYSNGKYRSDRNEVLGFFEAIEKFRMTDLPIGLDHYKDLIAKYKKRILPYPHYSGITVKIPADLKNLNSMDINN